MTSTLTVDLKILDSYKKYLKKLNITPGTTRSYLSDTRHFLAWYTFFIKSQGIKIKYEEPYEYLRNIKNKVIDKYADYQISNQTPIKTVNRRLSALRKFGNFCQSQNWLNQNIFTAIHNITDNLIKEENQSHLEEYRASLIKEGYSPQTIKCYLSDIRQFINWLDYHR